MERAGVVLIPVEDVANVWVDVHDTGRSFNTVAGSLHERIQAADRDSLELALEAVVDVCGRWERTGTRRGFLSEEDVLLAITRELPTE
jgi:hypothetical protein